ncbi:hypothetical protein [Pseudomonas sp. EA_35y_Pfl2_R5]|uniref:hypothetical protein n=1 Tax=Pseudomonas sp. EA_35y_Pfl2_R5 TaxID=3088690 RepID=UPI0030DD6475
MTYKLPYPFDVEYMRRNKAFLLFCPPDRLDEEQRPVLEGRSVLYKLDESSYQSCPYSDSRGISGKPINVESLKALSRHQDAVAKLMEGVGRYVARQRSVDGAAPDLSHMYALAYIGYRSPSLYFCRKLFDEEVEIPSVCSVASRFFHGLMNMLALIALEHDGVLDGVTMTPEQLYRYADDRGHLIGIKESCAASKAAIVKYLSLSFEVCIEPTQSDQETLGSLLPFNAIGHAAQVTMELEFASLVYETVRCWLWRRMPGYEGKAPAQKFATTHCLLAKKIAQAALPFEHVLFKRARNLMLALGSEGPSITRLIEMAHECLEAAENDRKCRAIVHERLKFQMLEIFEQQTDFLEQHVIGGCFLSSDLDSFFGNWPN